MVKSIKYLWRLTEEQRRIAAENNPIVSNCVYYDHEISKIKQEETARSATRAGLVFVSAFFVVYKKIMLFAQCKLRTKEISDSIIRKTNVISTY